MQTEGSSQPYVTSKPARRWVWMVLSYGVAAACLYWVFYDIRFPELLRSLVSIDWWWVPLAIVLELLVYVCAAWEWQWLLRPVGHLSLRQALQALFAGRFANDVLPVHAGYIIRVYLVSRWMGARIATVVPSLLIERLFDTLWLALGIGLAALFFPLPKNLARTGEVLGWVILVGVAAVAWMSLRHGKTAAEQKHGVFSRWRLIVNARSFVQHLAQGIRSIGRSYVILAALGLSILKLFLQGLAFLLLLRAYGFSFSFWMELAVFLIAYIGISMPSTPASVGVFQFFCVAGLQFFGVPKPAASGFALLAYVVWTVPLAVAGFFAIAQSGLTLRQIRREASAPALRWLRS